MAIHINPETGDDSNSGTEFSPKRTWGALSWSEGQTYLGRAGATAPEAVVVGANNVTIGSYGGTGPHFIRGSRLIDSAGLTIDGRSNIEISDLSVEDFLSHGVRVHNAFGSVDALTFTRVVARGNYGTLGQYQHGVFFDGSSSDSNTITNIETYDCSAINNGGTGFHHVHRVQAVTHYRLLSEYNGHTNGAHGSSSHPSRETLSSDWTNTSGNIWKTAYAIYAISRAVVASLGRELTYVPGGFASLGNYEYDISGGEIYVNLAGSNPNSFPVRIDAGDLQRITYLNSIARYNVSYPDYPYHEGHGFSFDDGSADCVIDGCLSYENEGHGFINNGGPNCIVRNSLGFTPNWPGGTGRTLIFSSPCQGGEVLNNLLVCADYRAIQVSGPYNGAGVTVANNIVAFSNVGLYFEANVSAISHDANLVFGCNTPITGASLKGYTFNPKIKNLVAGKLIVDALRVNRGSGLPHRRVTRLANCLTDRAGHSRSASTTMGPYEVGPNLVSFPRH